MSSTSTVQTGVIATVNDRGVRLTDSDGWVNFSKWSKDQDRDQVEPGDRVELQLDKSGFVRVLTRLEDEPAPPAPDAAPLQPGRTLPCKDVQIVRQTCLKIAATFVSAHPELKSCDLFALAERAEAWVLR